MLRVLIAATIAATAAATCGGALAQPLYKCNVDGTVTYSSEKCKGKTLGEITAPEPRKVNPALLANIERDKALGDKLEKERLAREAKEKEERAGAEKAEPVEVLTPTQRRCARLQLDKKLADEKLVKATEADRDALRQDAQRKTDVLASECPG